MCVCVSVQLFYVISFESIINSTPGVFTNKFMKIMFAVKNSSC